ncbi:MAG: mechanosensitive ion channel [Alphaproteobacteria bacterium]|nr:mechanosensitive ion channel [Alphaproteobacteria bacterium]
MPNNKFLELQNVIIKTYGDFYDQVLEYIPQIFLAIFLFLFGLMFAHLLRIITRKFLKGFDSLIKRLALFFGLKSLNSKHSYEILISKFVFWLVLIFFIASSANVLGWKIITKLVDSFMMVLPNLVTFFLIVMVGFLLSMGVRTTAQKLLYSAGFAKSEIIAQLIQALVLFTAIIIGVEQIGLHVQFLTMIIIAIISIVFAGVSLAFGLGAKTFVSNIISAQYINKHCDIDDFVQVGEVEGKLIEITQTFLILETQKGRTMVPAKYFHENVSTFYRKDTI